ncbi:protein jim lovell isoform X2 [Anthonomus grandis grandis]|uniref:protein jim lovell isoform X2 n=1 Tax=Anthonomus grandis grandis TaxID=2921223 RepID=UPI002165E58F|nr:protein jim lovell isoform X2 [Anthonomus grandis grandis]
MAQSHYSLRWNNHQSHILAAFEALLQAETLVDCTLVCAENSVRAHKVVLSACSPMFQRIFSENPCKHPVIVLKDFNGWEVQAIVDFMYKGEISVIQEQLPSLIKAAENLQVRGLANQDSLGVDKDSTSILNQTPTPSASPTDFDRQYYNSGKYPMHGITARTPVDSSPSPGFEPATKLPHMSRLSFPDQVISRECQSPLPRRKQARPRRRSGELSGPQDLSTNLLKSESPTPMEATAENLCMKRKEEKPHVKEEDLCPDPPIRSPDTDMTTQSSGKEFRASPISQPTMNLKQEVDANHSPLPFPPMPTVSALAMTPPHSKFFGLDAPLGLFPPGLDSCRNPLFDMTDPRNDSPMFVKKKMGRPKGQHSAPRGGPPRSWTNAELTEALQHVWNKKMTTSQASRIFGIPYNSLLMYVRGKYGKSLKLEQLRKDCIGPNSSMDMLGNLGSNNNNNNLSKGGDKEGEPLQPNTRPPSTDQEQAPPQHPLFNPFSHNFYPDFGTGFPIPVNMIHLLPQSEKNRLEHNAYGQTAPHDDDKQNQLKEIDDESVRDMYRLTVDDRRELVHQNGQD